MTLGERYTQSQAVRANSLSTEGFDAYRIEKVILKDKTSAGTPYLMGLKIMNPNTRDIPYSEPEVRRRKALNAEMDQVGITSQEYRDAEIGNNPNKLEALLIQKKTRKFMHNIPNDLKRKLLEESIQLLRR